MKLLLRKTDLFYFEIANNKDAISLELLRGRHFAPGNDSDIAEDRTKR